MPKLRSLSLDNNPLVAIALGTFNIWLQSLQILSMSSPPVFSSCVLNMTASYNFTCTCALDRVGSNSTVPLPGGDSGMCLCPIGQLLASDGTCTLCPRGTYNDVTGAELCHKCSSDYTVNSGSKSAAECKADPLVAAAKSEAQTEWIIIFLSGVSPPLCHYVTTSVPLCDHLSATMTTSLPLCLHLSATM